MVFGLLSCNVPEPKHYKTENIQLRQLVKTDEVTKESHASYFLISGSYSSREEVNTTIKLIGKVNGLYRLIEFDFNDARIKIDNSLTKPHLYIKYSSYDKRNTSTLLNHRRYDISSYVIVCPEKYLPEKLLPINL
jgi:hypothetical protein